MEKYKIKITPFWGQGEEKLIEKLEKQHNLNKYSKKKLREIYLDYSKHRDRLHENSPLVRYINDEQKEIVKILSKK
jgi:hypothetical protein